ncbi:MAG: AAC(3) family N-acetyltransferase [Defluviitaleaceae bacterium]|nr:AAC(3) family N-acetyltransferase [Defluviitaleaceae bacterium]
MFDKIIADLHALGVGPDDTLLVHSSLKSMGYVEGGAKTVIKALIKALSNGTLLFPGLSYETVTKDNPHFSVNETPSCVGIIPETFRKYPGVVRSVHPTHSVCAIGVHAEEITKNHAQDTTPIGPNSPFRLLCKYGGKILMLGCGLRPNTFMHGVEEAAGVPYLLQKDPIKMHITDNDGNTTQALHYRHNFSDYTQRYDRITECYNVTQGRILEADAYIIDAAKLWDAASKKMAQDPWFFVDKKH